MPKKLPVITIGCDPEIFIRDPKTNKYLSAHDKIPGTKIEPFKVPYGAIQVDGVAAEFNIDPTTSSVEFIRSINAVIQQIQDRCPELELCYTPIAIFDKRYFKNLPLETRELGCNPDWCAWTGELNPSPKDAANQTTMRTAAGHIHIGWTKDIDPTNPTHKEDCVTIVKNLDYYEGMMSILWDNNKKRRELYGKAGAMRFKPYGLEYRTMSNVWLTSQPLQMYVWNNAFKCMNDLLSNKPTPLDDFGDACRYIIDNSINWTNKKDLEAVREFLPRNCDLEHLRAWYPQYGLKLPPKIVKPKTSTKTETKPQARYKYNIDEI